MIDINEVVKPFIPDIPFHKECDIDRDSKKLKNEIKAMEIDNWEYTYKDFPYRLSWTVLYPEDTPAPSGFKLLRIVDNTGKIIDYLIPDDKNYIKELTKHLDNKDITGSFSIFEAGKETNRKFVSIEEEENVAIKAYFIYFISFVIKELFHIADYDFSKFSNIILFLLSAYLTKVIFSIAFLRFAKEQYIGVRYFSIFPTKTITDKRVEFSKHYNSNIQDRDTGNFSKDINFLHTSYKIY